MLITSNQNPKFKELLKLKDKKYRVREKKFILEGRRIIEHGIRLGFPPLALYALHKEEGEMDLGLLNDGKAPLYYLERALFERISDTVNSQGLIAIFDMEEINKRIEHKNERVLILNGVSDPGNMGTILRTAEAFGFTEVYITKGGCDPYSDKVLRSSMGAIFKLKIRAGFESEDLINYLKSRNYTIIASSLSERTIALEEASALEEVRKGLYALTFGNEGCGIDEVFQTRADVLYKIAMPGCAESLNVAAAAAISLYAFTKEA